MQDFDRWSLIELTRSGVTLSIEVSALAEHVVSHFPSPETTQLEATQKSQLQEKKCLTCVCRSAALPIVHLLSIIEFVEIACNRSCTAATVSSAREDCVIL